MLAVLTTDNVDQWFEGQYSAIPAHMRGSLENYVLHGQEPGRFLAAVICNDLRNAVGYADPDNLQLLKIYVQWFYNLAPQFCHGDRGRMQDWLTAGGLEGVQAARAASRVAS